MSDYYRDVLRTKEEELRIANDLIDLKDGWLRSLNRKLEHLEEENKNLKQKMSMEYKDAWQKLKEEMLQSYTNYEEQKRINENVHKILEGAQISLSKALKEMDKLDGSNEFSNLLDNMEDE